MERAWIYLLVVAFSGIAIFGFFAMGEMGEHGGCLAATALGGACPASDPLSWLEFHARFFAQVASAVSIAAIAAAFSLAVAVSAARAPARAAAFLAAHPARAPWRRHLAAHPPRSRESLTSWIRLLETSPTSP